MLDALIAAVSELKPDDFVCFNIGNSSLKLFNDNQALMESWQRVDEKLGFLKEVFGVYNKIKVIDITENEG